MKDWMSMKKDFQHSNKNDDNHDDIEMITERNLKRRFMLHAATNPTASVSTTMISASYMMAGCNDGDMENDNDLYSIDD
jgi:hypothetical protein